MLAEETEQGGTWLNQAMEQAWEIAGGLASHPALADLLGERYRIIADDWQSAGLQALVARLLRRALELSARVDFSPPALRADLRGERTSELFDRASDLLTESATLVHERHVARWSGNGPDLGLGHVSRHSACSMRDVRSRSRRWSSRFAAASPKVFLGPGASFSTWSATEERRGSQPGRQVEQGSFSAAASQPGE